jgi:Sec-independent protein translocase protein TatA
MYPEIQSALESAGFAIVLGLMVWVVKRVFSHTIPRLAGDFKESIAQLQKTFAEQLDLQRKDFKEELQRQRLDFRESLRDERHDLERKLERLTLAVEDLLKKS